MDGAAKFVRGDAIAGLIITSINILGGLAIGLVRHGLAFSDAADTYTTLTVGDGLVSQMPALLVSIAAGIVVTKGGIEGTADAALVRQLGTGSKPLALAGGAAAVLGLMPGLPTLPFFGMAGLAGGCAFLRHRHPAPDPRARAPGRRRPGRAADHGHAAHRHHPRRTGLRPSGAGRRRPAAPDGAGQGAAPEHGRGTRLGPAAGAHPGQHAARSRNNTSSASRRSRPGAGRSARTGCSRWTRAAAPRNSPAR